MEYFMTVASTCMMFAMFPLGLFSLDIELAIINTPDSSTDVTCGSKVVFMCSLSTAPTFYVEWLLDGSPVSKCDGTCHPTSGTLSHYTFTQNSVGTEYHLTINPLTLNDSKSLVCQDDNMVRSNTIKTNVVDRYTIDTLKIKIAEHKTTVHVAVTMNCLPSSMNVVYRLKYKKKDSLNANYVDFPDSTLEVQYLECTNCDNPYCGGNATRRSYTALDIRKSNSGVTYTFLLRVEDNGLPLDHKLIGSFVIEDQSTSNPRLSDTDNSSDDTQKKTTPLVVAIILQSVVFAALLVVFLVRIRRRMNKERKLKERFEKLKQESSKYQHNLED